MNLLFEVLGFNTWQVLPFFFDHYGSQLPGFIFDKCVKHVKHTGMKTITIRDLRQRWPEAEKALSVESELIVTRDGKPVAKLVSYANETKPRKRFNPVEHLKWQRSVFGKEKKSNWIKETLMKEREDRKFRPAQK